MLTNLQYNPHALQFNSSFNPRRQSGVWVAPQLEHSAFPPVGGGLFIPLCFKRAGLTLVAVAPRADDRLDESVFTVNDGLPKGVLVLARGGCWPMLEGEML